VSETPSSAPPPPPRRWAGLVRDWGPRAVFESLLIVFSISLALALSGWMQSLNTQQRLNEARAALVEELAANRALLLSDDYIPHHVALEAALGGLDTTRPLTGAAAAPADAMFRTGVHFAPLRDAVWQSVLAGGLIEHMPSAEVFALYDAYRAQDQLATFNASVYPELADFAADLRIGADARRGVIAMRLYLGDVIATERRLIESYDAAIAALEH
jgi:hypothetical protein